jgi:pyroglutamyl-peptidase
MGDIATQEKPTVIVTGFGPFASHSVNASWVAVQEMERTGGLGDDVTLVTTEIPVAYDVVNDRVPKLWTNYQPKLVVHVGVSGIAKELTLEQMAHNEGYDKVDIRNNTPMMHCCQEGGQPCLVSSIDMGRVCEAIKQSGCGVDAVLSFDPGRYLCDFIYYTSLSIDCSRCAFIHVPPLNRPYTAQQLASAIRVAVRAMLDQLAGLQQQPQHQH